MTRSIMLDAPFAGDPVPFIATEKRFQGIMWGNENLAIVMEGLAKTRVRVTSTFNPARPAGFRQKDLRELNSDDRYNNPGFPAYSPQHA